MNIDLSNESTQQVLINEIDRLRKMVTDLQRELSLRSEEEIHDRAVIWAKEAFIEMVERAFREIGFPDTVNAVNRFQISAIERGRADKKWWMAEGIKVELGVEIRDGLRKAFMDILIKKEK